MSLISGRRVRGRQYPWGFVEVDNPKHSDFALLRSSSSHVFTNSETTDLRIFFTKFSLFCFSIRQKLSIEIKNANIIAFHNRERHFKAF